MKKVGVFLKHSVLVYMSLNVVSDGMLIILCEERNVCVFAGHHISALKSVPTAVYSFLRCMRPVSDIPDEVTAECYTAL